MRITQVLITTIAALTLSLTACGGGGDDGGDDVQLEPDAMASDEPDAMEQSSEGLGQVCNAQMACPADEPQCVQFEKAGNGFCTHSCGTGPVPAAGEDPEPPANGNTACMTGYTGTATPVCAVYGAAVDNMIPWSCGLACGTFMNQDLGTCPAGLTCAQNFCTP